MEEREGRKTFAIVHIADYEKLRSGNFAWRSVKSVPVKEVHFPELPRFPFAQARQLAIENMSLNVLPDRAPEAPVQLELPFDEDRDETRSSVAVTLPALPPTKFRITQSRIIQFGETPGC